MTVVKDESFGRNLNTLWGLPIDPQSLVPSVLLITKDQVDYIMQDGCRVVDQGVDHSLTSRVIRLEIPNGRHLLFRIM